MDAHIDLYAMLDVPEDATPAVIRGAYRKKILQCHPDRGGDPKEFELVQEAYTVLSDPPRRARYDATGLTSQRSAEEEFLDSFGKKDRDAAVLPQVQRSRPSYEELMRRNRENKDPVGYDPPPRAKPRPASPRRPVSPGRQPAEQPTRARTPSPLGGSAERAASGKVRLPPAFRAALEGRTLETLEVPEEYRVPMQHVVVAEQDGVRSLAETVALPQIEEFVLKEGEVLVQMRAAPLSVADLALDMYRPGDVFGTQGVGQVRLVGPKVEGLHVGDWVLPVMEVDEDGDLVEEVAPGTCRVVAVFRAAQCARLGNIHRQVLSVGQMAVAKSLGAAKLLAEQHVRQHPPGETVILNAANGVVGQVLVQMLSVLGYVVLAVVRRHEGAELLKRRLEELGATKVLFDGDDLRGSIEELQVKPPVLALDAVGGEATSCLAATLSRTGDIVCYGQASGSRRQVLPGGWGKKWKGALHHFSFDEWLQQDLQGSSERLSDILDEASKLMQAGRLKLETKEYAFEDLQGAIRDAERPGRSHAVVLLLPSVGEATLPGPARPGRPGSAAGASKAAAVAAKLPGQTKLEAEVTEAKGKPSWDMDFLGWDEDAEERLEKRAAAEGSLFQQAPLTDELSVYVDDALATRVAVELGAPKGEADAVLFWLAGPSEVPEEHTFWLNKLAERHGSVRILILQPRVGRKWYDISDGHAVRLGLHYGVVDDFEDNADGDPAKMSGDLFFPALEPFEVEALQQVESAAIWLARRALIEEKGLKKLTGGLERSTLPFFFGGFGQGGAVALFTAICLMPKPINGVAFCHSGVPVASHLGKRMTEAVRLHTMLFAFYDDKDDQVPTQYADALVHMFKKLKCNVALEWLRDGDGHNFNETAAEQVSACVAWAFKHELRKMMEREASRAIKEGRAFVAWNTADKMGSAEEPRGQLQREQAFVPMWERSDRR